MGFDSPSHWLIAIAVFAVLFGYKKLPEMSRSVGRSLRIFKTEMKGLGDDDATRDAVAQSAETAAAAPETAIPVLPPVPPVTAGEVSLTKPVAADRPAAHE
ncbi:sec-independent protein translocase protein TatA [Jatrophihabitans sp. GAS493]|uniref:Sec-independent protein translocase subunit TatA n=1 Tax=Jatrophihabitans sp. GAS493 TaxID=1907575 RepID=UPI000BB8950F|nr:Sec-independent protein translocase subunit TatA [Jatrophihabitans sp. GAS493]SOD74124.1 sec-independent protein translocase protein TatA [Jatrophihabitans sp. GAS493]